MTVSSSQRLLFIIGISLAGTLGLFAYENYSVLPALHSARESIDNTRASIQAKTANAKNLAALQKDIDSINTQKADLEKEVWSFLKEDTFYQAWPKLATANHVTIAEPKIADAAPTGSLLIRPVTLTISGPYANVLNCISAIQALHPLVGMHQINLTNATDGGVTATVDGKSLWK